MTVVSVFAASYCNGSQVAAGVAEQLGYSLITDEVLIDATSESTGLSPEKLQDAIVAGPGFFNRLTREKEKLVARLRAAMIDIIATDNLVFLGAGGLLIPADLTHVLRVCLAGMRAFRLEQATGTGLSNREAEGRIRKDDDICADWTKFLFDAGPWDKSLYDVFLAMQSLTVSDAVDMLCKYARRPSLETTDRTPDALDDARLAAQINIALVDAGYDTDVASRNGHVTILIRGHTLRLGRLQDRLRAIAKSVPGVEEVTARPGPRYHEPSVYAPMELDVPSKVLLVDDESEFVNALSERLHTRGMAPSLAYDGAEALSIIATDQPEVMVLDLRMPGIDGLEVLRRVKRDHPETEVIILTGHGSESEESLAAQLGAFAYLRKPVDIDVLTETMKKAYQRVNAARSAGDPSSTSET